MSAAAKQGNFGLYWAACRMHGVPVKSGSGSQVVQEGTIDPMLAACPFLLQLPLLRQTPASGKLKNFASCRGCGHASASNAREAIAAPLVCVSTQQQILLPLVPEGFLLASLRHDLLHAAFPDPRRPRKTAPCLQACLQCSRA